MVHVDGSVDPVRDKEVIDTELQLKDLETLEKRLDKQVKAAKTGDKQAKVAVAFGERVRQHLLQGKNVRSLSIDTDEEQEMLSELQLLTSKPVLYVCNVNESDARTGNAYTEKIAEIARTEDAEMVIISAAIEADIAELETKEDRLEFLEAIGLTEPGVNKIINAAYHLLGLITYFTAGVKEVRAWTITRGTKAPQAAGVIHTDFEKGFIRAEVIGYDDFVRFGSEAAVKDAGKMTVEGKDYIVHDGDVMHFRFNV